MDYIELFNYYLFKYFIYIYTLLKRADYNTSGR